MGSVPSLVMEPKTLNVAINSATVTGALHDKDGVPNQDNWFEISLPRGRLSSLKPRTGRATVDGIYATGVFDGHGKEGHVASKIAADHAKETLTRLFETTCSTNRIEDYVRLTFEIVANALHGHNCSESSGTTATIAVVYDSRVVVAHCGDSSAQLVACSKGSASPTTRYVTRMHRVTDESEKNRIEEAGGLVQDTYVLDKTKRNGISVTRTIGDRDMHKVGCTPEPEIRSLDLTPGDSAIILATDGLWDCEGLVVRDVLDSVKSAKGSASLVNESLMTIARQTGPSDDCTIVTMTFT